MPESTTTPSADGVPGASRWARARRTLRQALRVDHWNVGLIRAPIASLLAASPPPVEWMPEPLPGRLNADPFGVIHEGRRYVLYEALDYEDGRGFLAGREVGDAAWGAEFEVLREPFHLSYPYVVQHEGEVYCIPERFEAREIAIFRAVAFPGRWERFATIRSDFCGIDSTILLRDGRWWCWTTDREAGHDRRLQLLFADDLAGPWWPHPQNPIREEIRAARGAGTPFEAGGDLYRPGQDYSRKNEERITLNRVVELSTRLRGTLV